MKSYNSGRFSFPDTSRTLLCLATYWMISSVLLFSADTDALDLQQPPAVDRAVPWIFRLDGDFKPPVGKPGKPLGADPTRQFGAVVKAATERPGFF